MSYRTAPTPTTGMPSGVPYIIGNEAAERFSFYGMRAILYAFMTTALVTHEGAADLMSKPEASKWFHWFVAAAYTTPLIGGQLADLWLGKYRTIILLSLVYCLGHLALAIDHTRVGLTVGLSLIALGAGGIKPCVSAHVGDQFGTTNAHLLPRIFNWFYFSINVGAAISMLLTPWLLKYTSPHIAFGVPGILMFIATVVFWMGRHQFIHIPADPRGFAREFASSTFRRALAWLIGLYILIAAFWAVFDQTGSRWVAQAEHMDRKIFGMKILPSALQSANPFFVLLLIPFFTFIIYPAVERFTSFTPLRRIGTGFLITAGTLGISMAIETWIAAGQTPTIWWQILAYLLLTSAEIMISITALEFSYTQAPVRLKSFIMSLYMFLSVALGNGFTALVNAYIEKTNDGGLEGSDYYAFFLKVLLATFAVFLVTSVFYKEKHYIQEEALDHPDDPSEAPNV